MRSTDSGLMVIDASDPNGALVVSEPLQMEGGVSSLARLQRVGNTVTAYACVTGEGGDVAMVQTFDVTQFSLQHRA